MTVDDFDWAFNGDHDDDKEEDERYSFLVDCTLLCWERISVRNNNKNKHWWFGLVYGIWSSYNFSPEAKNEKKVSSLTSSWSFHHHLSISLVCFELRWLMMTMIQEKISRKVGYEVVAVELVEK